MAQGASIELEVARIAMSWSLWKQAREDAAAAKLRPRALPSKEPVTPHSMALHPLVKGLANRLAEPGYPGPAIQEANERRSGHVIAIGSGKGGVGKTLVSSSIALELAEHSAKRVVAIDVDLGGANLHTGLGIRRPSFALNQFIMEKTPLRELSVSSGFNGLQFVSGASEIIGLAEFTDADRARFLEELRTLPEVTVVLDLGAGSSLFNLDLFCTAQQGILVTTTEPTAVQNAYGFLRAAVYRRLRLLYRAEDGLLHMIGEAANHQGGERIGSVPDLIQRISKFNRSAASRLEELIGQLRIGLVVNMAKSRDAALVADRLARAVRQYLGVRLDFLGSVDLDESVRRSVHEWRPLVVHYRTGRAARRLVSVAAKVGNRVDM